MPPAPRIHPSSAPSTPYRARTFSAVVDASAFSPPATSEHGRRRAVSSSTSPYPQTRQAIAAARAATRNEQRVRRVLAEIDWWTVMSGQRPDEEDEEQEEEGEQQGLFLANAQHVVFDGDELENESAEEHPMLTPSSLAPSSEGGSQFADDDCEDTATAHDEHANVALPEETSLLGPAIILTEDALRPSPHVQENTRPPSPSFPSSLPPLSPLLPREAAEPSRQPRDPLVVLTSSFRGGNSILWQLPPSRSKPSTLSAFRRALGVAPGSVSDNILREALAPAVNANTVTSAGVGAGAGAAVGSTIPSAAPVTCGTSISLVEELGKKTDSRLLRETGPLVASLQ